MWGQRRRDDSSLSSLDSLRPVRGVRPWLLAALLPMSLAVPAAAASSQGQVQQQAQGSWRGLDVPRYPNGSDVQIEADSDEYELYFRSSDNPRAVYDYYRGYLQKQGFRVARTKTKAQGFKADMVRGRGGPNDSVELDVKLEGGLHKVEIEFDE